MEGYLSYHRVRIVNRRSPLTSEDTAELALAYKPISDLSCDVSEKYEQIIPKVKTREDLRAVSMHTLLMLSLYMCFHNCSIDSHNVQL